MLTIFLSGGMSGLTHEEMTEWRDAIKTESKFYNMKVISPPDYFMYGCDCHDEDKESFVFDTYWVKKSDVVIVNMNSPKSIGTAQEVMLAYEYNKPIIMISNKDIWDNEVSPWLKHEATTVFFYENYDDKYSIYEDVVEYAAMYERV